MKFLKISKPCAENWENMSPNEKGNYCDLCSKNVIDFTHLSQVEISNEIKKAKGNICARVTKNQLSTPLLDLNTRKEYNLPFSNIAAGLMIVTSLTACQTNNTEIPKVQTEISQNTNTGLNPENRKSNSVSKTDHLKSNAISTFEGSITNEDGEPVGNAKVIFVTIKKIIAAHTSKNGSFSMEIPEGLIDDDNVIRVSFYDINKEEDEMFWGYETDDYLLSKEELNSNYKITARPAELLLGDIAYYTERIDPVVIDNGLRINYEDFIKAQTGKKSTCSIENKEFYYFESKIAMAIYGEAAKGGLYILAHKTEE